MEPGPQLLSPSPSGERFSSLSLLQCVGCTFSVWNQAHSFSLPLVPLGEIQLLVLLRICHSRHRQPRSKDALGVHRRVRPSVLATAEPARPPSSSLSHALSTLCRCSSACIMTHYCYCDKKQAGEASVCFARWLLFLWPVLVACQRVAGSCVWMKVALEPQTQPC